MTQSELNRLKKLCEEAIPGPWEAYKDEDGNYSGVRTLANVDYNENVVWGYVPWEDGGTTEAVFIAEARNALPQLIAEVERLREALKEIGFKRIPASEHEQNCELLLTNELDDEIVCTCGRWSLEFAKSAILARKALGIEND